MKFAFVIYKYFPFGGVQRDCLRIAQRVAERGHEVEILCISWEGDRPEGLAVQQFDVLGITNHRRYRNFARKVRRYCDQQQVDGIIGFNKLAGLDLYFAADGCYRLKAATRTPLYRLTPRYQYFVEDEASVFGPQSSTHILALGRREMLHYQQSYGTPPKRFTLLPPGISADRKAPANSAEIRRNCRLELNIRDDQLLLLMVGSGFKTKGLDRALLAIKSLPSQQRQQVRFVVIGKDNFSPFRQMAGRLGISEQLTFFPGREDIPRFLQAADYLMHPAYYENSGMILLEALVAGLPVLATSACGYAHFIEEADAGVVLPAPFEQEKMNAVLADMLVGKNYSTWRENGIRFGQTHDLFSLHDVAAETIERVVSQKQEQLA
ncbi:MAG TPA: glucosyltransferase I RfaG [Gammaproteobacteria bacterium]|nr:glucosyltransferase I RfaG [Gammaproteobacteria bacterium]